MSKQTFFELARRVGPNCTGFSKPRIVRSSASVFLLDDRDFRFFKNTLTGVSGVLSHYYDSNKEFFYLSVISEKISVGNGMTTEASK